MRAGTPSAQLAWRSKNKSVYCRRTSRNRRGPITCLRGISSRRNRKRRESRRMSAYAGMIDRVDQEMGRLLANLTIAGELDNTLIVFVSDNGACPFDRGILIRRASPSIPPRIGAIARAGRGRAIRHFASTNRTNSKAASHRPRLCIGLLD